MLVWHATKFVEFYTLATLLTINSAHVIHIILQLQQLQKLFKKNTILWQSKGQWYSKPKTTTSLLATNATNAFDFMPINEQSRFAGIVHLYCRHACMCVCGSRAIAWSAHQKLAKVKLNLVIVFAK